jgi:hypothetical protein
MNQRVIAARADYGIYTVGNQSLAKRIRKRGQEERGIGLGGRDLFDWINQ